MRKIYINFKLMVIFLRQRNEFWEIIQGLFYDVVLLNRMFGDVRLGVRLFVFCVDYLRYSSFEEGEISVVWEEYKVREDFLREVRLELGGWKRDGRKEGEFERKFRGDIQLILGVWLLYSEVFKGIRCVRFGLES